MYNPSRVCINFPNATRDNDQARPNRLAHYTLLTAILGDLFYRHPVRHLASRALLGIVMKLAFDGDEQESREVGVKKKGDVGLKGIISQVRTLQQLETLLNL